MFQINNKTHKLTLIVLCFCFGLQFTYCQDNVPFTAENEFYIYGDAIVIGNNILSIDKSEPFNDRTANNDNMEMTYVDIDDDIATFSSSQASLEFPEDTRKVAYAGLYWTATYAYKEGIKEKTGRSDIFKGVGKRDNDFNTIKFKGPNGEYQDVTGSVIFDGNKNRTHRINSPYVCYADVTEMVENSEQKNGAYTIANVKASEGFMTGGSAAGWMLYVVYEAPTDNPKFITTFNGFALVNKEPVDINFKNFKSIDQSDVRTSIVVSALEGDATLERDECSISKADGSSFLSFSNGLRKQRNFFNSTISSDATVNMDRLPNSSNTLGFDIAELNIPDSNRTIINNSMNETTLRLNTKSDRFYLYFTAFQTEISQSFFSEQSSTTRLTPTLPDSDIVQPIRSTTIATASTETPVTIINTKENIRIRNRELTTTSPTTTINNTANQVSKPRQKPRMKGFDSKEFERLRTKRSASVPGLDSGYYVITNVFSNPLNASKWEAYLITKGLQPTTFINPKNNWHYVYIYQGEDIRQAFTTQQETTQKPKMWDTWILKVNMD